MSEEGKNQLRTIDDLRPWELNPRLIRPEAMKGLRYSIREFGDLSGIVWNERTGRLVTGHKRMEGLRLTYGENLRLENGEIVTPDGERFRIRIVDWDEIKELAANLAANNPGIQGEFTPSVARMIAGLKDQAPDYVDELILGEINGLLDEIGGEEEEEEAEDDLFGITSEHEIPEMALQPYEHYDYLLILVRTTQEWDTLRELMKIEKVNSSPLTMKKKIGLGRAIPAARLFRIVEEIRHGSH